MRLRELMRTHKPYSSLPLHLSNVVFSFTRNPFLQLESRLFLNEQMAVNNEIQEYVSDAIADAVATSAADTDTFFLLYSGALVFLMQAGSV